jgi:hypothetical protein
MQLARELLLFDPSVTRRNPGNLFPSQKSLPVNSPGFEFAVCLADQPGASYVAGSWLAGTRNGIASNSVPREQIQEQMRSLILTFLSLILQICLFSMLRNVSAEL